MAKTSNPAWEFADHNTGDPQNVLYCKFCKHKITARITRLKNHLAGTKKGVKICKEAPASAKQTCKELLLATELEKKKRMELVRDIGRMSEPQEDVIAQELESVAGSNSQSWTLEAMNKYFNPEVRQSTLESALKEGREKCVRKIARCIYALGLPFNIIQTPYWKEMIHEVGTLRLGFKQPNPYKIRTRVCRTKKSMSLNLFH
jgi:hypothetical protein